MNSFSWNKDFHVLKLLALITLALVIKGWNIGETDIGVDECFSAYNAQLSVPEIVGWLLKGNNPPLWEIILHYWIYFFGIEEVSIRFLSLIFNVGTIIPIYLIGERFFGKNIGFFSALFFVFSSFALFMAHEARVYSLLGFLSTWSVYFYFKILNEDKKLIHIIFLTLINGLILYCHYLGYWIIMTEGLLFLLISTVRKKIGRIYWYHILALFLLFAPLINVVYTRMLDSGVNGTWVQKSSGIESLYFMIVDFFNKPVIAVIFLILLIFGLVRSIIVKAFKLNNLVLNLLIWVPLIVSFLISFKIGIFLNRYFYFLLPLLYLNVVSVLFSVQFKNSIYNKVLLLVPLIGLIFSFKISTKEMIHSGNHQEIKPLVEKIKEIKKEINSIIYISPVWFDKELVYYLDRNLFSTYFQEYQSQTVFKAPLNNRAIFPIYSAEELKVDSCYKQIVFVDNKSDFHLPNNGILKELKSKHKLLKIEDIKGIIVYTFQN